VITVSGFDHLVLRCVDVETTLAWYVDRIGLTPVRVDEWRAGEAPFPSVRVDAGTILDLVPAGAGREELDGGRLGHICLVTDAAGLGSVIDDPSLEVVDGPGPRFGARGVATSVYVTDPDGLVVELRAYPD
jgi:catechol 2,3-dioxygenase-like lactoylglutathione lyase family enzyme